MIFLLSRPLIYKAYTHYQATTVKIFLIHGHLYLADEDPKIRAHFEKRIEIHVTKIWQITGGKHPNARQFIASPIGLPKYSRFEIVIDILYLSRDIQVSI